MTLDAYWIILIENSLINLENTFNINFSAIAKFSRKILYENWFYWQVRMCKDVRIGQTGFEGWLHIRTVRRMSIASVRVYQQLISNFYHQNRIEGVNKYICSLNFLFIFILQQLFYIMFCVFVKGEEFDTRKSKLDTFFYYHFSCWNSNTINCHKTVSLHKQIFICFRLRSRFHVYRKLVNNNVLLKRMLTKISYLSFLSSSLIIGKCLVWLCFSFRFLWYHKC